MIWIRRSLAVLLAVLFIPILLLTLVFFRINETILSADFYIEELRKADVFSFLYDELLPAAFDEASSDLQDLPIDPESVRDELMASLREVLPPEWLQGQVEMVIGEAVPYMTGGVDDFAVTLSVAERLGVLGEVIKREVGSGDTYDLLFDQVIAPALEEQLQNAGDLPFGVTISTDDIVAGVREVVPPQWIQARVEHVVDQVVPFLTGETGHFAIHMPVADRLTALAPVLKEILVRSNVYNVLSSQEFAERVDQQLQEFGELPFGVKLTSAQIVPPLQAVAPPQWIQARVEQVLDAMVPYVTGDRDGFEVVVPLKDRIEAAVPAVKQLLRDVDAYNLLFDEVIATLVEEGIGQTAQLPGGITITADEVVPALREVLPPEFIQEQAENMLEELVPFLTGEAEGFRVTVPLADRKEAALSAIEGLASQKLEDLLATLPQCTLEEALGLVQRGFTGLVPPCRPGGFSLDEIKRELGIDIPGITLKEIEESLGVDLSLVTEGVTLENVKESLGIDVVALVGQFIGDALPDQFVYTDADLRETLGADDEELLDKVLDWGRNGFTYTDADLREDLVGPNGDTSRLETLNQVLEWGRQGLTYTDADLREDLVGPNGDTSAVETLDQVLGWTREGFTFTQNDLRKALAESEDPQALETFDTARQAIAQVRAFSFLGCLALALFLAAIGFLGGRGWRSRLAWAAAPLGIAAGALYAAFGPIYRGVALPLLDDRLAQATQGATGIEQLASDKAIAVARMVLGDLVSGLESRALLLLIVAAVTLGVVILLPTLSRTRGRGHVEGPP